MGSTVRAAAETVRAAIEVWGTDELQKIEVVAPSGTVRALRCGHGEDRFSESLDLPADSSGFYYLRITQSDGERAWTSPVFFT